MNFFFAKKLPCKNSLNFIIAFTFFLMSYIIAECFFRQYFEEYSDEIAIEDQKSYKKSWDKFLSFITSLGYGLPISIIVLFYYELSENKINAIFLILLTTYINYFLSILKMIYNEPRPYMRNSEIIPLYKCGLEWGNPSGHAMNGFFFYFIVFNSLRKRLLGINFEKTNKKNRKQSFSPINKYSQDIELKEIRNDNLQKETYCLNCKHILIPEKENDKTRLCAACIKAESQISNTKNDIHPPKIEIEVCNSFKINVFHFFSNVFCYFFSFTLIALIGYSRFYFGLHSVNQILLGWVYGLGFIVYFYFVITSKELIVKRILVFFEKIANYKSLNLRLKYAFYITFFLIMTFLIPWIIYYVHDGRDDINPIFLEQMRKKCGEDYLQKNLLFYANCFSDIGSISIIFGIFYGIIASSANYAHEEFWQNYLNLPLWKKALRIIILGTLTGTIFGIFTAISFEENAYIICFLDNGLKGILLGFLIVVFLPKIYFKLNLDVKGDFMREKEI